MTLIPQGPDMAWLSNLVYEDWPIVEAGLTAKGFDLLAKFDHHDTEGMLVSNKRCAAMVFRGTQASELHTRDIFSNAGVPVRWAGKGRVHSGYENYLNMIRHRARELAEDVSSDLPLFATGHSLGGSVATLFASWWYGDRGNTKRNYELAGLCTYGAPKALDREAGDAIKCPIERCVMLGDWFTRHPLSFILTHPAPATWLKPIKWWRPTPIARHSAGGYAAARARVR